VCGGEPEEGELARVELVLDLLMKAKRALDIGELPPASEENTSDCYTKDIRGILLSAC